MIVLSVPLIINWRYRLLFPAHWRNTGTNFYWVLQDVTGWWRAASGGSLSLHLIHRALLLSVLSRSRSVCNNLFTSNFYRFLIHCVSSTSSAVGPALYLHSSLCVSQRGTQTRVYLLEILISCLGCVSHLLFSCPAHIKHPSCWKPRERERRIHIKHVKENVDGRGTNVWGQNPDWWQTQWRK